MGGWLWRAIAHHLRCEEKNGFVNDVSDAGAWAEVRPDFRCGAGTSNGVVGGALARPPHGSRASGLAAGGVPDYETSWGPNACAVCHALS